MRAVLVIQALKSVSLCENLSSENQKGAWWLTLLIPRLGRQ